MSIPPEANGLPLPFFNDEIGDNICADCGKDFLLHCICEDYDSQHGLKEMEAEMDRESRYCLEPLESSPGVDYYVPLNDKAKEVGEYCP